MSITHTRRMASFLRQLDEPTPVLDYSRGTYCAPCMWGGDEYTAAAQVPVDHVPLLADDEGICCNCGRHTDGHMVPGKAGQERWIPVPDPHGWAVGIYEVDLAYGGPEEGGWWYGTGVLQRTLRTGLTEDAAFAAAARANRLLAHLFRLSGRRSASSAAYEGGEYAAKVYPGACPDFYPAHRPRYE